MVTPYDIKFRFNPTSTRSKKVLGPLEGEIMDIVWEQGPTTVAAVHKALRSRRDIAYTTVMTTMSRLARKNLLLQDTSAQSYVYTPSLSREDFERYVCTGVIRALLEDYGPSVIDHFVNIVAESDPSLQERLRSAVCK
jgi:predicted transcriptional regulator